MVWGVSSNFWKIDFSSDPGRAKFSMLCTHHNLAEHAKDTESIINLMTWAVSKIFFEKSTFLMSHSAESWSLLAQAA